MKVLHLSSERTWRGGEQQLAYLAEVSAASGLNLFFACRKNSAFEKMAEEKGWKFISLPFKNEFDPGTALAIKKLCIRERIDLIHAHSAHSHALAVLSFVLGNERPIVVSRRVDFPVKKSFLSKWKYNHPSVKRYICVSNAVKNILQDGIKNPQRCVTVYDGIDFSKFVQPTGKLRKELGIGKDVKLIGNVAALAPHKDYFTWLKTIKDLHGKLNAKYLIIGDGALHEQIQQNIHDLHLQNEVIMLGFRNDINEILPELDLLLYTSETEGLGSTILDAIYCGVPVVATKAGGIPEIITSGKNGMLAEVKDHKQLAAAVIKLFTDPAMREAIIAHARIRAAEFGKQRMGEETMEIYRDVIGEMKSVASEL